MGQAFDGKMIERRKSEHTDLNCKGVLYKENGKKKCTNCVIQVDTKREVDVKLKSFKQLQEEWR